jgi:hypothetical protein
MSIPRQLVKSFDIIRNSNLVVTKEPSDENLREFGKALNNAIPDDSNQISYMIYKFMRGMYLRNKSKFIQFIMGMQHYESMILWTDYDDILSYFELTGEVFLGWNKSVNKYQAAKIDLTKKKPRVDPPTAGSVAPPPTGSVAPTTSPATNATQEEQVKSLEQSDDYDILYDRIAKLQASMN